MVSIRQFLYLAEVKLGDRLDSIDDASRSDNKKIPRASASPPLISRLNRLLHVSESDIVELIRLVNCYLRYAAPVCNPIPCRCLGLGQQSCHG